jgi:hypothetical protein
MPDMGSCDWEAETLQKLQIRASAVPWTEFETVA